MSLLQGVETLPLRMERHCSNANEIALWLQQHPQVGTPAATFGHLDARRPDRPVARATSRVR